MTNLNSLQANECYKMLSKHVDCLKCNIAKTQDNYKKGRTVCNLCCSNRVLAKHKKTFCPNSPPGSDVSTQTDF